MEFIATVAASRRFSPSSEAEMESEPTKAAETSSSMAAQATSPAAASLYSSFSERVVTEKKAEGSMPWTGPVMKFWSGSRMAASRTESGTMIGFADSGIVAAWVRVSSAAGRRNWDFIVRDWDEDMKTSVMMRELKRRIMRRIVCYIDHHGISVG